MNNPPRSSEPKRKGKFILHQTDYLTVHSENLFEKAYTGILIFPVKLFIPYCTWVSLSLS